MTQTVSLIIHDVMDSPERFSAESDHITNGYYVIAMDGSFYGMGASKYHSAQNEKDMLARAVAAWKSETGWVAPSGQEEKKTVNAKKTYLSFDEYSRKTYEEFARVVRSNLKSFTIHKDANTFSNGIQSAVSNLDNAIRQIDAVNADAK